LDLTNNMINRQGIDYCLDLEVAEDSQGIVVRFIKVIRLGAEVLHSSPTARLLLLPLGSTLLSKPKAAINRYRGLLARI
jgi:hypothetical protein